jgi:hypothetical protein
VEALIADKFFVLRRLDLRRLLPYPMVSYRDFGKDMQTKFCCYQTHFPKQKQILETLVLCILPMTQFYIQTILFGMRRTALLGWYKILRASFTGALSRFICLSVQGFKFKQFYPAYVTKSMADKKRRPGVMYWNQQLQRGSSQRP